jgi:hypothetical protein
VYDTVQVPDERMQEAGLNIPPRLPSLQDMEPVGVSCESDVSVTLTVNNTGEPWFVVSVLDVTTLEVELIVEVVLGMAVEFESLNKTVLELFESGSIEKAYCGKTNTAAIETKSRILRSILHDLPYSINKELLYIVQEQCYP